MRLASNSTHPFLYTDEGELLGYEESVVIEDHERPWLKKVWQERETKEWRLVWPSTRGVPRNLRSHQGNAMVTQQVLRRRIGRAG